MNMHGKKYLIFDFDGTIADTLDLLVKIYNKICHQYGCLTVDIKDKEELKKLTSQEILRRYKISFLKIPPLLIKVKKEFKKQISEVKIFEGMGAVLKGLKNRGFDLYILTSNSKENVEIFLKDNDLLDIFSFVYSSSNVFSKDKSIKKLIKFKDINLRECLYIGDETRDIEAMQRIGLPITSVSWGFNSKEALVKLGPDKIVEKPEYLLDLFSGKGSV